MTSVLGHRRNLRSYLYVPGDGGRRLELAESRRADAVIADLEDSVVTAHKSDALKQVLTWLNSEPVSEDSSHRVAERWVRVNAGDAGLEELDQLAHRLLEGVVLPKIASSADLAAADRVLTEAERRNGLAPGAIALMPLIETADAVVNILPISRAARVVVLQLGEVDLAADLGIEPGANEDELAAIRLGVVVASRASGLAAPVGPVSTNYSDLPLFRVSTERLRRLGFVGRVAIHPAQLPIIHDTFRPAAADIESARELLHQAKQFAAAGQGAWVGADGTMVDEAVLRRARQIIDSAETKEGELK
jgi:citrate lyase subunit beta/citryl-CoA lyase